MLKISKCKEPDFFRDIIDKNKPAKWDDLPVDVKKNLKIFILENEQKYNELTYCVYCELIINEDNSHFDHIKPKSKSPEDTFSYNNLVISCEDQNSCGKYKENKWDENFINPVTEDPELFFEYSNSGEIVPGKTDNERARITIYILNLNNNKLRNIRRIIIKQAAEYSKEHIDSFDQFFKEFPSLIKYLKTHRNN